MQFDSAQPCMGQGSSNIGKLVMTKDQKLALAGLFRIWRNWFGKNWFTTEDAIRCLDRPADRDLLRQAGIESEDGDELSRRLDELRNRVIYNFVVKRDAPYMQPVKWRILLQDNRIKVSAEEQHDFVEVRREAGLKIDPATAEVDWSYEQTLDPYGIDPDLPEELQQVGRQYFARAPGSDIWVSFYDLPDETRKMLWNKLRT